VAARMLKTVALPAGNHAAQIQESASSAASAEEPRPADARHRLIPNYRISICPGIDGVTFAIPIVIAQVGAKIARLRGMIRSIACIEMCNSYACAGRGCPDILKFCEARSQVPAWRDSMMGRPILIETTN
jgi:hypothetical protein